MSDDWAIVVGIQEYPGIPNKISGAVADAEDFERWLLAEAKLDPAHVLSVIAPPPMYGQVHLQFVRLVEELLKRQRESGADRLGRRLYIYLAGHGLELGDAQPALLTTEARDASMAHIAGKLYAEYFYKVACFDEIVLFMDCCRTPSTAYPLMVPILKSMPSLRPPPRTFYGYATLSAQIAYEQTQGNATRGRFTSALLDGLRGAAAVNGKITDATLKAFVEDRLRSVVATSEDEQLPQLIPDPRGGITLHQVAVARYALVLRFPPGALAKRYTVTGKNNVVVDQGTIAARIDVELPNGSYAIAIDGEMVTTAKIRGADVETAVPEAA